MGKLGNACRARAAECVLVARAAGWRGDNALKAMYLTLAQQWLDIAEIGDAADQELICEMNAPDDRRGPDPMSWISWSVIAANLRMR
jgi:hypothetical protein